MQFILLGFDFYKKAGMFGFWMGGIRSKKWHRSLLCIYWDDGELIIEIFWLRICNFFI